MVVLCCSLRGGFARAAGWSDGFRQVASFSASVVFQGLLNPHQTLGWAPTQSGGPRATTSLSTVGCKPGHDTSWTNSVPASTGKTCLQGGL